ncbi:MAG: metallophosphoesterase [Ferruginibacter sp.]
MRKLLQKIFKPFFIWLADKFSAAPKQEAVFKSLTRLYKSISTKNKKGIVLEITTADKFIIFSDQHKGAKDVADDFAMNETCYITALKYYFNEGFNFINLGDSEELLKYAIKDVLPKNKASLETEALFHQQSRYYRTFGNHDIAWKNPLDVSLHLKSFFPDNLTVHEGLVLRLKTGEQRLDIFLTHGHQGDSMSDGNPLSGWLLANIWAPIQRFLEINVNMPSVDPWLRNKHNRLMHEWSSKRKQLLLVTGHTHKPVFASGRYTAAEEHKIDTGSGKIKPVYFNTGCCCYNDGDITGIEISNGFIRLVKWKNGGESVAKIILEEKNIRDILTDIQ